MGKDKYSSPSVVEAPWLIATHESYKRALEKQTFCTFSPNYTSYVKTIVELNGKSVLASSLGWLILRERENQMVYSLWNPVTLQILSLPVLVDAPGGQPICVFTSAPDDDDATVGNCACVLMLIFEGVVFFCKPTQDDCTWFNQRIEHNGSYVRITTVAMCRGDVYAYALYSSGDDCYCFGAMFARIRTTNDNSNSLIFEPFVLELPEKGIGFKVYPIREKFLVEVRGILYFVHMMMRHCDDMGNFDIFKAFVWRLDLSQMKWIQVESLGNIALLLGDYSSTWFQTDASCTDASDGALDEGDCIYLAKSGCQTVHLYRLRDNSCTFLLPHRSFLGNVGGPTWFMPNNHNRSVIVKDMNIEMEKGKHVEDMTVEMDVKLQSPSLSQFPTDILESIANRLHLFDYMNLRATSKTIRSEIPQAKWRATHCSFPLFMSLKNNKGLCELWDPRELNSHTIKTPYSPLRLSSIEFCKDGWLLLRNEGDSLQYFNPFTRDKGTYPPWHMTKIHESYAFSTCPNSSDCVTVGIKGIIEVTISCFQAASGKWVDYHFLEDTGFRANPNSAPKYHNGAFYFIGVKGHLGVFEMVDGKWSWKVYYSPLTEDESSSLNSCYLVELEGELLSVFIQHVGRHLQVFKFETVEKCWVELDDLGDHVLFLSPASSFSASGKDSAMRNRIYLPRRHSRGNGLVYYSFDTFKYHTSGDEDPMDDLYGTSTQSFCCWI